MVPHFQAQGPEFARSANASLPAVGNPRPGRTRMVLPAVVAVLVVGSALGFWLVVRPWFFEGSGDQDLESDGGSAATTGRLQPAFQSAAVADMGLQVLLAQEANPKADVDRLRADVLTFSRQHAGLPQALKATELLMRLPSPLDQLDRRKIPPDELATAGGGDPRRAPNDLVAVFRASRVPDRQARTGQEPSPATRRPTEVRSLAFSGDGGMLATGGADRTVRIWDTSSGKELHESPPQESPVNAVAFAAENGLVASATEHGTIELWQADTGKELRTIAQGQGEHGSLAFSPNGRVLACGNDHGIIKLWDADTGTELFFRTVSSHTGPAVVAFSSDGRMVASGGGDGEVHLWDAITGDEVLVIKEAGQHSPVASLAFSPDKQLVAAGGPGFGVRVWQAATGQKVDIPNRQTALDGSLAFRSDGRLLACGGTDGVIHLWDVAAANEMGRIPLCPRAVPRQWAFSPDGRYLATANGAVYIYRFGPQPPGRQR